MSNGEVEGRLLSAAHRLAQISGVSLTDDAERLLITEIEKATRRLEADGQLEDEEALQRVEHALGVWIDTAAPRNFVGVRKARDH